MSHITIFVEPKAKARPRTVSKSGRTWAYTPKSTAFAEEFIRSTLLKSDIIFDAGVPLRLEAIFYIPKPKSISKKVEYPVKRPDLDQYIKLLLDAVQKYIFPDDSQVVTIIAKKRYGYPPRIELFIEGEES